MRVQWYRIKKTYEKPHGGFLAIGRAILAYKTLDERDFLIARNPKGVTDVP
jgi:hypothetical protein